MNYRSQLSLSPDRGRSAVATRHDGRDPLCTTFAAGGIEG